MTRTVTTRRGVTLIEVAVATAALAMLMIGVLKVVDQIRQQTRELNYRQAAIAEAQAALDAFTARGWSAATTDAAEKFQRDEAHRAALPEGELKLSVEELKNDSTFKRVDVEISWPHETGVPGRPVRLRAWIVSPRKP